MRRISYVLKLCFQERFPLVVVGKFTHEMHAAYISSLLTILKSTKARFGHEMHTSLSHATLALHNKKKKIR